ncbi:hypothetical protein [Cryobacterium sp. Y50]|uniref:hypothetical protein n=1 Tax=Cryobacterium sp. Y50 TaxID=2048286 RepID=UPI001304A0D9|nr:hypothetical protein [Cryobacterium sp. Y50]
MPTANVEDRRSAASEHVYEPGVDLQIRPIDDVLSHLGGVRRELKVGVHPSSIPYSRHALASHGE